jgi:hypothetical protein
MTGTMNCAEPRALATAGRTRTRPSSRNILRRVADLSLEKFAPETAMGEAMPTVASGD